VPGVDIKWPNDVLIVNHKVAGILAEVVGTPPGQRVILGIGVNLNHRAFPPELAQTATSVLIATEHRTEIVGFRDALLTRFEEWYRQLCLKGSSGVLDRWQLLSSYAHGRRVAVIIDDQRFEGETAGLTPSGALRLLTDDGGSKILVAGEVSKVRLRRRRDT
jgi:BirA family biotin operon repressor/biotin-[acetyl-CoA-carboxylase] ligase